MTLEYLNQYIAHRIKVERSKRGWSQKTLGKEANVGEKTIGKIEQCKGNPSLETLDKIAIALDIDILDLCPQKKGIITIDLNALEALKNR